METNDKFLLCFTLLSFFCSARGLCRTVTGVPTDVLGSLFAKFFTDALLDDKCISAHNQAFWNFKSSFIRIGPAPSTSTTSSFTRNYLASDGTIRYSSTGFFEKKPNEISWSAQGGIPGGTQTGLRTGRMFILNIQPSQTGSTPNFTFMDGTVITYYSCFDSNEIINENVYIVQAPGGTKELRDRYLSSAKNLLKDSTSLSDLSNVTCY